MNKLYFCEEKYSNSAILTSERNLNPKAACLKRREEEKADEMPGGQGLSSEEIAAQHAQLAGKVRNMLLPLQNPYGDHHDYDNMDH